MPNGNVWPATPAHGYSPNSTYRTGLNLLRNRLRMVWVRLCSIFEIRRAPKLLPLSMIGQFVRHGPRGVLSTESEAMLHIYLQLAHNKNLADSH